MTDNTQPEVGSTNIIRYALELGLLWVDGSGRDKVREALAALDAIEAQLASIGAGGVQALSASPSDIAKLRHLYANLKTGGVRDTAQAKRIADGLLAPIIERLEQAAPKAAPAWEHHARKLTQWLHCMSHNDSYFGEPAGLVKQVTGELNRLIGAAPQQEAQEPVAWLYTTPMQDGSDFVGASSERLQIGVGTPPGTIEQPLYAAPQPAPAPLSEREAFEAAWEKLHGKRPVLWSQMFASHKMETPAHSEGKYFAASEQAAWKLWQARAALAAQGGKV